MLLAYDVIGSGPPVLLLHSGVADRRMWDPVAPQLSHRFRLIRPDFRGYGESPLPPEPYTDADDAAGLLDHLGVADVAVVGSSFGGRVALELAVRHPDRVRELVLLCPAYRGEPSTPAADRFAAAEDRLLETGDIEGAVRLNVDTWLGPEATDPVRTQVAEMQRHALAVQLATGTGESGPEQMLVPVSPGQIRVPTVVVSGGHDLDAFQNTARTLAGEIPGAELVELPWAGHLPSLERPDAVVALLLDVLRNDPDVHAP
jgi:pimeloyl-ACP methyl ester carboxylesterase